MNGFEVLTESEYQKLKDAIALITVYISGADGEIEAEETEWAAKITRIRSYNTPDALLEFYKEVGEDFQGKLDSYIADLPKHPHTRNPIIEERLENLNPILASLPKKLGAELYDSYVSFAKHVAKATGGFLGFFSIGPKEAELLDLKMISPIVYTEK